MTVYNARSSVVIKYHLNLAKGLPENRVFHSGYRYIADLKLKFVEGFGMVEG
jgi:hypothetical protein